MRLQKGHFEGPGMLHLISAPFPNCRQAQSRAIVVFGHYSWIPTTAGVHAPIRTTIEISSRPKS